MPDKTAAATLSPSNLQYLKGVVPRRFLAANTEFTGLSTVARTAEGFWRGTNIPKLTGLKMQREAEVLKVGNRIFDRIFTNRLLNDYINWVLNWVFNGIWLIDWIFEPWRRCAGTLGLISPSSWSLSTTDCSTIGT